MTPMDEGALASFHAFGPPEVKARVETLGRWPAALSAGRPLERS